MILYGHKKIKKDNASIKDSNHHENGEREQSKTEMYLISDNMGLRERGRQQERQTDRETERERQIYTQTDREREEDKGSELTVPTNDRIRRRR